MASASLQTRLREKKKLKSRFPEFIFPQKIFLLQVLQKIYFCFYWEGRRAEVPEENLFVGFDRELGGARVPHVVGSHPERRWQIKSFFKARFLEVSLFMITENLNSMFLGQIFVYDESDHVFYRLTFSEYVWSSCAPSRQCASSTTLHTIYNYPTL